MANKNIEPTEIRQLYKIAFGLAIATIILALLEGLISTYLGYEDESLTLFGFGLGSCIEVISGLGIATMIIRIRQNEDCKRGQFEITALKITGYGFYVLVIGLASTSIYNSWYEHKPINTIPGVVIALISIALMLALIYGKTKVGKQLNSDAILADAECTKICVYMSLVLLIASGIYQLTNFAYIDSIGALGLAYFSFKEGRECFEKVKSNKFCSCKYD